MLVVVDVNADYTGALGGKPTYRYLTFDRSLDVPVEETIAFGDPLLAVEANVDLACVALPPRAKEMRELRGVFVATAV